MGVSSKKRNACSSESSSSASTTAAGLLERERPDVVLEAAELDDDVRRHDVRPSREELAELDEGRPELVEQLAQMAAPLRAPVRVELDARCPREDVRQLVALEEVAEAVPDRDLRDLGEPADLAGAWRHSHRPECCTAAAGFLSRRRR